MTMLYTFWPKILKILKTFQTNEMEIVSQWLPTNKLILTTKKTKVMIFGTPHKLKSFPPLKTHVDNDIIEQVTSFKYVGVMVDNTLSFAVLHNILIIQVAQYHYVFHRPTLYIVIA